MCRATKNPHLTIVKDATEESFSAVGDVIHYTITATNDGNTTLTNVTVTDPNAGALNCTPQTPVSSLAPGGTITCTASHTITQADIDAGHYLNTACVDATGATQACSGVDVLAATLTIDKTNNAPLESLALPNKTVASLPTADEGETVTYTLSYTIGARRRHERGHHRRRARRPAVRGRQRDRAMPNSRSMATTRPPGPCPGPPPRSP